MKTNTVSFKLSDLELEKLGLCVEKLHLNQSDIIRMGLWKMYDQHLHLIEVAKPEINYIIDQKIEAKLKERGL